MPAHLLSVHSPSVSAGPVITNKKRHSSFKSNLRSKRFHTVSEQKKTEERDFWFWPREKWNEPFFTRSLTLVPRSLLRNRTEMVATQAISNRRSNFVYSLVWL